MFIACEKHQGLLCIILFHQIYYIILNNVFVFPELFMYVACMINKISISKCLPLNTQTLLYLAANVSLGYFQVPVIRDSVHVSKQSSLAHSRIQVVYYKIYTNCTVLYCIMHTIL